MDGLRQALRRGRTRLRRLLGRAWRASSSPGSSPSPRGSNETEAPFYKWFEDGRLNASYNCLDRHVEAGRGDDRHRLRGRRRQGHAGELPRAAGAHQPLANALKARGVKKGERVVIYMPMSVEGVVAMQACARIGATHSVVFGGFSATSCATASRTPARSSC
ncbi:MAG: AMP-binding protein [Myxococcales bacterium]